MKRYQCNDFELPNRRPWTPPGCCPPQWPASVSAALPTPAAGALPPAASLSAPTPLPASASLQHRVRAHCPGCWAAFTGRASW